MTTTRELAHSVGQTVDGYQRMTAAYGGPEPAQDIRLFGAKKYPIDCSDAFDEAVNQAGPGGAVYIPFGRWAVSRPITLTDSISIIGGGMGSTLVGLTPGMTVIDAVSQTSTDPSGWPSLSIENIRIDGGGVGINFGGNLNAGNCSFRSILLTSQTFASMRFRRSLLGAVFTNCTFYTNDATYGVYTDLSGGVYGDLLGNTTWINCQWTDCAKAGGYAFYCTEFDGAVAPNICMINPVFQGLQGRAIYLRNSMLNLESPHFEGCGMGEAAPGECIHMSSHSTSYCRLNIDKGVWLPADGTGHTTKVKFLNGNCQLFASRVFWYGGEVIDMNNIGGASCVCYESMGTGAFPTVINGAPTWSNGPVHT